MWAECVKMKILNLNKFTVGRQENGSKSRTCHSREPFGHIDSANKYLSDGHFYDSNYMNCWMGEYFRCFTNQRQI